jgi:hypothetical protein
LLFDWLLSVQVMIWTQHKQFQLQLYNNNLKNYKIFKRTHPQLAYRVNVYESLLGLMTNRNPINAWNQFKAQNNACLSAAEGKKHQHELFNNINLILKNYLI